MPSLGLIIAFILILIIVVGFIYITSGEYKEPVYIVPKDQAHRENYEYIEFLKDKILELEVKDKITTAKYNETHAARVKRAVELNDKAKEDAKTYTPAIELIKALRDFIQVEGIAIPVDHIVDINFQIGTVATVIDPGEVPILYWDYTLVKYGFTKKFFESGKEATNLEFNIHKLVKSIEQHTSLQSYINSNSCNTTIQLSNGKAHGFTHDYFIGPIFFNKLKEIWIGVKKDKTDEKLTQFSKD